MNANGRGGDAKPAARFRESCVGNQLSGNNNSQPAGRQA
jgi:hypothetical protein